MPVRAVETADGAAVELRLLRQRLIAKPAAIADELFERDRLRQLTPCLLAVVVEGERALRVGDVGGDVRRAQDHPARHLLVPERHRLPEDADLETVGSVKMGGSGQAVRAGSDYRDVDVIAFVGAALTGSRGLSVVEKAPARSRCARRPASQTARALPTRQTTRAVARTRRSRVRCRPSSFPRGSAPRFPQRRRRVGATRRRPLAGARARVPVVLPVRRAARHSGRACRRLRDSRDRDAKGTGSGRIGARFPAPAATRQQRSVDAGA